MKIFCLNNVLNLKLIYLFKVKFNLLFWDIPNKFLTYSLSENPILKIAMYQSLYIRKHQKLRQISTY